MFDRQFSIIVEGRCHLLVCCHPFTGEIKSFLSNAPANTPVKKLLRVAFGRRRIERCFEDGKGEVGLDHWVGRRWIGLKRHLILTMVSYLFLAKTCQRLRGKQSEVNCMSSQDGRDCAGLSARLQRTRALARECRRVHRLSPATQRVCSHEPCANDDPQIARRGHQAHWPAALRTKTRVSAVALTAQRSFQPRRAGAAALAIAPATDDGSARSPEGR